MIGDVGEGTREEVDWAPSPAIGAAGGGGDNYGWSCREGMLPGLGAGDPFCAGKGAADFTSPVFEYDHVVPDPENGVICSGSIIGGYVVRNAALGGLAGRYVYADYCTGEIRSLLLPDSPSGAATDDCSLGLPIDRWTSFGEDADGRLYVSSNKGGVYRFTGPLQTCLPDEEGLGSETVSVPGPASAGPPPPKPELRIVARLLPGHPPKVLLSVTVSPCAGQVQRRVQLRRGGEPNGSKPVGEDCRVRFRRRLPRRSTFRAQLLPRAGTPAVRSRPLVLSPQ